jgi:hypothetical protein
MQVVLRAENAVLQVDKERNFVALEDYEKAGWSLIRENVRL